MSLASSGSADRRQALLFAAERDDRLAASSNRAIGSPTVPGNFSSPAKRAPLGSGGTDSGASPRRMLPPPLEARPPLASRSLTAAAAAAAAANSNTSSSTSSGGSLAGNDEDDLIVIDDPDTQLQGGGATNAVDRNHGQASATFTRDPPHSSDFSAGASADSLIEFDSARLLPFDALPLPSAYAALLAAFVAFENVLVFHHAVRRREYVPLPSVQTQLERATHRRFSMHHLAQLVYVFPEGYDIVPVELSATDNGSGSGGSGSFSSPSSSSSSSLSPSSSSGDTFAGDGSTQTYAIRIQSAEQFEFKRRQQREQYQQEQQHQLMLLQHQQQKLGQQEPQPPRLAEASLPLPLPHACEPLPLPAVEPHKSSVSDAAVAFQAVADAYFGFYDDCNDKPSASSFASLPSLSTSVPNSAGALTATPSSHALPASSYISPDASVGGADTNAARQQRTPSSARRRLNISGAATVETAAAAATSVMNSPLSQRRSSDCGSAGHLCDTALPHTGLHLPCTPTRAPSSSIGVTTHTPTTSANGNPDSALISTPKQQQQQHVFRPALQISDADVAARRGEFHRRLAALVDLQNHEFVASMSSASISSTSAASSSAGSFVTSLPTHSPFAHDSAVSSWPVSGVPHVSVSDSHSGGRSPGRQSLAPPPLQPSSPQSHHQSQPKQGELLHQHQQHPQQHQLTHEHQQQCTPPLMRAAFRAWHARFRLDACAPIPPAPLPSFAQRLRHVGQMHALDALYTGLRSPAPLTISSSSSKAARGGGALMIRAGPVASLRMGGTSGTSSSSSCSISASASVSASASASVSAGGIAGGSGCASPARFPVDQRPCTHADTALAQQNIMRPHSAASFSSRILSDAVNIEPSHSSAYSMLPPTLLSSSIPSAQVGSKRRAAALIDIDADCEVEIDDE